MPGGDRTGPWGRGPRTGRGMGFCSGYDNPGYATGRGFFRRGRGFARGGGYGRGRGPGGWFPEDEYYPPAAPRVSRDEEKIRIERSIDDLEVELKELKGRLKELEKDG